MTSIACEDDMTTHGGRVINGIYHPDGTGGRNNGAGENRADRGN